MSHLGSFVTAWRWNTGQPLGQLRAAPVALGGGCRGLLMAFAADAQIDPSAGMFFYPTDTLKLAVVNADGGLVWQRDLGRGVVPGIWFCPILPCDLDGDGVDEVWYVDNADPVHPLAGNQYRLTRLDGATGAVTGSWPWPQLDEWMPLYAAHRNFILCGRSGGEMVLVTAQGTYGQLRLQGWNRDLTPRWNWERPRGGPGGSGSHMSAVADLYGDGNEVVVYGEHLIDVGTGIERATCDGESWKGHSDINQPVRDRVSGSWSIFTCRESANGPGPRVVSFAPDGSRRWAALEEGHMDMGWVAHLPGHDTPTAYALRIGTKKAGPDGTHREQRKEFGFCALTGTPRTLPCSMYASIPVDHDGDGQHSLVRVSGDDAGTVFGGDGRILATLGGDVALVGKLLDRPGEQILAYDRDGEIRIWADTQAVDRPAAQARVHNSYYGRSLALGMVGYHLPILGGL